MVLNGDDPMLASLRGRTPVPAVFCGREEGLEYRARRLEGDGDSRILCQMTTPGWTGRWRSLPWGST